MTTDAPFPGQTFASVTDKVSDLVLTRPVSRRWLASLGASFALVGLLLAAIGVVLVVGVGVWGINVPVSWGFAIVNFVWWIGIGHAGTLISAILLLMRQGWRTSVNRFAEAMTLFSLTCAGLFPLLHMGRPGFFYWLLPYPSTYAVWPQFRSPLVWDVFAIGTYFLVSFLFWYVGMIPDLATLRDRARNRLAGTAYALLALGWRGDSAHWRRHKVAYTLLAGLATALVISVHSIVAFDFAVTVLPGWHTLVFPPYFVAGAMLSGFAMVLVLVVPLRAVYGLRDLITPPHLDKLAKLLLATSSIVGFVYVLEPYMAWYGGKKHELDILAVRAFGPYAAAFWAMVACNVGAPQLLWAPRLRRSPLALWLVGLAVLVGMWLERYVIVLSSLHRDFLPSSWGPFTPTVWDWATFVGTFGLFAALMLLFLRVLPAVAMSEVREHLPHTDDGATPEPPAVAPGTGPAVGLLAEYDSDARLVSAVRSAKAAGLTKLEVFSPVPVPAVWDELDQWRTRLPLLVAAGGVAGAAMAYAVQTYTNVIEYPLNVGGRPLTLLGNWPAFAVTTFEVAVLAASLVAVVGLLLLSGLPRLHHPVFAVPAFARASQTRFFLLAPATDAARQLLPKTHPLGVWEVPS